ncbi:hypothetical protein BDV97DRAFT_334928 [Delphinella strobiligena]|nr:hypothetical protein BDV97DRAFT_334928 [Delphinella strobiligena]
MTTRKHNEYLDIGLGEDEDEQGYDSEEQQESRVTLAGRSMKRRRVEQEDDDSDDESTREDEARVPTTAEKSMPPRPLVKDADEQTLKTTAAHAPNLKALSSKKLEKSQKAAKKTGVIYLSRVPPFMKPATLKHLLTPYGEIGRVFLTPEDSVQHQRRVRSGGNKKKSFTDGWVEFVNKKNAKIIAESLNGNIIGGKKGNFYHDDVWNIKYLKGFKWSHLTEQIANENAERAARLRAEISKTRRENKAFVDDIERAKMLEGMQTKKRAKQEKAGETDDIRPALDNALKDGRPRRFKQNQVKLKRAKDGAESEQPEAIKRVLSSIF